MPPEMIQLMSCCCRPDMAQLTAVLGALHALCSEGQVMVDLFVNYDCDLQAANLFERSMKGLSKLLKKGPTSSVFAAQQASKTRDVALDSVLAMLRSLNMWAEPLKVRRPHARHSSHNGHHASAVSCVALRSMHMYIWLDHSGNLCCSGCCISSAGG